MSLLFAAAEASIKDGVLRFNEMEAVREAMELPRQAFSAAITNLSKAKLITDWQRSGWELSAEGYQKAEQTAKDSSGEGSPKRADFDEAVVRGLSQMRGGTNPERIQETVALLNNVGFNTTPLGSGGGYFGARYFGRGGAAGAENMDTPHIEQGKAEGLVVGGRVSGTAGSASVLSNPTRSVSVAQAGVMVVGEQAADGQGAPLENRGAANLAFRLPIRIVVINEQQASQAAAYIHQIKAAVDRMEGDNKSISMIRQSLDYIEFAVDHREADWETVLRHVEIATKLLERLGPVGYVAVGGLLGNLHNVISALRSIGS